MSSNLNQVVVLLICLPMAKETGGENAKKRSQSQYRAEAKNYRLSQNYREMLERLRKERGKTIDKYDHDILKLQNEVSDIKVISLPSPHPHFLSSLMVFCFKLSTRTCPILVVHGVGIDMLA